jgi:hypothetical protein
MNKRTAMALMAVVLAAPSLGGAAPRPAEAGTRAPSLPVKPTGPIAVEHRLAAEPQVGVPLEVQITARAEREVGGVTIDVSPSAPSAVLVGVPQLVTAGDNSHSWTISVVPLAADAGYLTVIVAGDVDGVEQARSVTVSLRGAVPAGAPAAAPPEGELLIALPVEESP